MYTMIAYTLSGKYWCRRHSSVLERFEECKGKENYRIVIKKGRKVIYSEVGK